MLDILDLGLPSNHDYDLDTASNTQFIETSIESVIQVPNLPSSMDDLEHPTQHRPFPSFKFEKCTIIESDSHEFFSGAVARRREPIKP